MERKAFVGGGASAIRASLITAAALLLSIACGGKVGNVTITQDYNLGAGQYQVIPVDLKRGDLLESSVTVRGGGSLEVSVRVEDPTGKAIVSPQQEQSRDFTVRAKGDGRHAVILDNSYSLFTGKAVTLVLKYPRRL